MFALQAGATRAVGLALNAKPRDQVPNDVSSFCCTLTHAIDNAQLSSSVRDIITRRLQKLKEGLARDARSNHSKRLRNFTEVRTLIPFLARLTSFGQGFQVSTSPSKRHAPSAAGAGAQSASKSAAASAALVSSDSQPGSSLAERKRQHFDKHRQGERRRKHKQPSSSGPTAASRSEVETSPELVPLRPRLPKQQVSLAAANSLLSSSLREAKDAAAAAAAAATAAKVPAKQSPDLRPGVLIRTTEWVCSVKKHLRLIL